MLLFLFPYLWIPLVGAVGAILVGRPAMLLVPVALEIFFWLGIDLGWWGYGFGEGTSIVAVITVILAVASAGVGLVVRRRLNR